MRRKSCIIHLVQKRPMALWFRGFLWTRTGTKDEINAPLSQDLETALTQVGFRKTKRIRLRDAEQRGREADAELTEAAL